MSKILFVSSEAFPLVKTGGLGDVAGSLPTALLKKSQDVRLVLPAYPEVWGKVTKHKECFTTSYYGLTVKIFETNLPGSKVKVWLVDCPDAFDRPGGPYVDQNGHAWVDNPLRFTIFCHAAVDIALNKMALDWEPDIVHCNDWQTGLIPALLSLHPKRPLTVFTIHNMAYQGVFDHQTFLDLHLPATLWNPAGLEYYGNFSFMKGGLAFADEITAVSPNYANEILSPEYGYGLDGLLNHRKAHLSGILNGIDDKYWNPGTDTHLAQKYNRKTISKKGLNKVALQEKLGLPINETIPMVGMVSRLVEQKGLDIILHSLGTLLVEKLQIVILGSGEHHYEAELTAFAADHPEKMKVIIGYDEALSHNIEAASDIYMMPSIFEPCGLNQIYSLRYGTLPVVTNVGGLSDTVTDANEENISNGSATGFVLTEKTPWALIHAMRRALNLYQNPDVWQKMQITAMSIDFSWENSAENYLKLYTQALKEKEV